ncbi:MAG: magnesium-translocating P-type ATPase [bacterium]|nr:magnesium-translocating P-type ATPase [bacterium]
MSSIALLDGLTSIEAAAQLKKVGENVVFQKKRFRPLIAFIEKFKSPLILILITASAISVVVGEVTSAVILLVMVLLSVVLDFVNTYKSQKAADELMARVVTTAVVMRDAQKMSVDIRTLVPGDIVFLSAGDVVPADARVLEAKDFFVNQAALTGESFPVEKIQGSSLAGITSIVDDTRVFMGTSVSTGFATVCVEQTGFKTEFGSIGARLSSAQQPSYFELAIRKFSFFVMQTTMLMVGVVFLLNAFVGHGWFTSFLFSVAIAVGLTPELLPVIVSVSLSRGSIRMSRKGVIVKNLSSIQNLGSMTILCADKTGTLTENHIVLVRHIDGEGNDSKDVLQYAYLDSFYHTGVRSPLDDAVIEYGKVSVRGYKKIDEIPFDFTRKRSTVVVEKAGRKTLITKGAPENIFKACSHYLRDGRTVSLRSGLRAHVRKLFAELSSDGFRVLAVAVKHVYSSHTLYSPHDESAMTFVGFVAFLDPPKKGARESIHDLEHLGIETKILTGDNEILTQKICRDLGIPVKGTLLGKDIAALNDQQLRSASAEVSIFARVSPEQKERIITALRSNGNAVGYLGDGINDAPALKAADVGVSVDNAVNVARDTADVILARKSLSVLHDGIVEGRRTFFNTQKYILMGLSSNFGNMFSMVAASAFLPFLPMLPTQVLLNNFFYDLSQISLPSDTVDADEIKRPPVWDISVIKRYMIVFGLVSSLFDFFAFGLLYWGFHLSESGFQTGWFLESIATQVFVIYIIRTKKIPFLQSRPSLALFVNTVVVVVLSWFIALSPLGAYFGFTALPSHIILTLAGVVVLYLALAQWVKNVFYHSIIFGQPLAFVGKNATSEPVSLNEG